MLQQFGQHDIKRRKMYTPNNIQDCRSESSIKQETESFYQRIGRNFKEET
jgi:hypothetical protein